MVCNELSNMDKNQITKQTFNIIVIIHKDNVNLYSS